MRIRVEVLVVALALILPFPARAQDPPGDDGTVGSDTCAVCHEETARDFYRTAHARAPGWHEESGCESCHGPGQAHVEAGDGGGIVRLGSLPPRKASEACLACHGQEHGRAGFGRSLHKLSDVGCIDCHDPHSAAEDMLPQTGLELCSSCHADIAGQFAMPRSHPLHDEEDGCATCHDPHGTKNPRNLRRAGNDTCTSCHSEKAGPFLYEHDISLVDGCRSCHEIHGSPNRHLLTHSRQINLCYQCHAGTTTPGFHSAPRFLNEKCTACHTAIHGSNTHPAFLEE